MIDRDLGWEAVVEALQKLRGTTVKAGAFDELAEIAFYNEYGTETIPQRSFIRSCYDENKREIAEIANGVVALAIGGKGAKPELLGEFLRKAIQEKIILGPFVDNAPSTIRRKGRNTPLIDTGKMLMSIRYEIEEE